MLYVFEVKFSYSGRALIIARNYAGAEKGFKDVDNYKYCEIESIKLIGKVDAIEKEYS